MLTGASFTGVMLMVEEAPPVSDPPVPVLPLSLIDSDSVVDALGVSVPSV